MNPTLFPWPLETLPRIAVAGYFPIKDRGFTYAYRIRHFAIHLYDYAAGMRLGDRELTLRPGDLTITPPEVETRYDLPSPGRHWCLHVVACEASGPQLQIPLHLRLGADATVARERLIRVVGHHRRARGMGAGHPAATAASAALLELLCWLAERSAATGPARRGERAVERAAELLRANPAGSWRVADLAHKVGLSPAYLARRFRRRYGHSLARFQLVQRIGAAQALLACTDLAVHEVGSQVGLPDPHHFNKLFRRVAGQPPSAFRSDHRL